MSGRQFFLICLAGLVMALQTTTALFAQDQDDEVQYVRNVWNFVEQSMDISNGIPDDAAGTLAQIRETGKLRVATEPYFPPQEFIDQTQSGQNRFAGADMKLARLIAERMGVTLEIIPMEFTDVLPALDENICDLAISALAFVPSRASAYELSKGYYFSEENSGNGIMIRIEDQDLYHSIEDFADKIIAAQAGSLQESIMADHFPYYKEFIRLNSLQNVYKELEKGKIDGAMADIETAQSYIDRTPDSQLMIVPELNFQLENQFMGDRIAAKRGQIQLIYFVNGVIDEVVESGQYMEWYREADELAESLGL